MVGQEAIESSDLLRMKALRGSVSRQSQKVSEMSETSAPRKRRLEYERMEFNESLAISIDLKVASGHDRPSAERAI